MIVLSRTVSGFGAEGAFGKQREWIDYEHDNKESRRFRGEMERINAFLASANLEFHPNGPSIALDTHRRRLRRYFSMPPWQADQFLQFDLGGRLFGGWWQNLPKHERHRIRIDGEPVVDLDFASMFPRLAYLKVGLAPPEGDLYAGIPGLGNPRWRDGDEGDDELVPLRP